MLAINALDYNAHGGQANKEQWPTELSAEASLWDSQYINRFDFQTHHFVLYVF